MSYNVSLHIVLFVASHELFPVIINSANAAHIFSKQPNHKATLHIQVLMVTA